MKYTLLEIFTCCIVAIVIASMIAIIVARNTEMFDVIDNILENLATK